MKIDSGEEVGRAVNVTKFARFCYQFYGGSGNHISNLIDITKFGHVKTYLIESYGLTISGNEYYPDLKIKDKDGKEVGHITKSVFNGKPMHMVDIDDEYLLPIMLYTLVLDSVRALRLAAGAYLMLQSSNNFNK